MTTSLYRHFDSHGRLLYVGVSLNAVQRLSAHRRSSWFRRIAKVTVRHFRTRQMALAAESKAMRVEAPEYNTYRRLNKKLVVYRLSDLAVRVLNRLAKRTGKTKTAIMVEAINRAGERLGATENSKA